MSTTNKTAYIVVLVLVILGAFFGYQIWREKEEDQAEVQSAGAGATNPFEQKLPNPLEGSSNPYENIKTNPFE